MSFESSRLLDKHNLKEMPKIRGIFKDFNLDGLFSPVVSISARVR
jgi:hypothetical protein